jgi:AraC-like DNA-binding protein
MSLSLLSPALMGSGRPVTVRAHDDGIDRWEIKAALPAATLRSRVSHYSTYWEHTRSFTTRRELAATCGVLIYALGAPLELVGADGRKVRVEAGEAFVGGIADATSLSRALGPQAGVHLFLPLASLAAVTGVPLAEIANRVVLLADLVGKPAEDLGHALCEASTDEARFALLDGFLSDRFSRAIDRNPTVEWAMRRLRQSAKPLTTTLAGEIGWSRRHFIHRFRIATGFSPDQFRRLCRFERFAAALADAPQDSLAALAADTGYVDQAHLTRDVRAFSAMTPGELRSRLLPAQGGVRD